MKKPAAVILASILLSATALPSLADDDSAGAHAASLVCGVVGTPIAMVRHSKKSIGEYMTLQKDQDNSYKFWGAFAAIPFGIVEGTIKGAIAAPINAVSKKPFSKDAFSLGDLD